MVRCTRKGCGQEYDPSHNAEKSCSFHPGAPVFHEGLKSWSCCADVNKPVLDFDEFMKLPGCHEGIHTDEVPKAEAPKAPSAADPGVKLTSTDAQSETYTTKSAPSTATAPPPTAVGASAPAPAPAPEEEEDLAAQVPSGAKCRHYGCTVVYESDEAHRVGDGPGTTCVYHSKAPIFHEGSKGYLCCKRRVLEFDEFLKIEGCSTGRHVFVPKSIAASQEEFTDCRMDHYQTPSEVHVSVFAKKADQGTSTVTIEETQIHFDLHLPASKRFRRSFELFGPVDSAASSYKFFGTKVEVTLKKKDTRSWTILEKPTRDLGGVALTFGVSGRTGTIGAKELILDDDNKIKRS